MCSNYKVGPIHLFDLRLIHDMDAQIIIFNN
jgi:hypothetical protein